MPDSQEPNLPQNESDDELRPLLADVEDPVPEEFLERVRRSIHRRTTVAQISAFSWRMPGTILAELVRVISFLPRSFSKDETRWK